MKFAPVLLVVATLMSVNAQTIFPTDAQEIKGENAYKMYQPKQLMDTVTPLVNALWLIAAEMPEGKLQLCLTDLEVLLVDVASAVQALIKLDIQTFRNALGAALYRLWEAKDNCIPFAV